MIATVWQRCEQTCLTWNMLVSSYKVLLLMHGWCGASERHCDRAAQRLAYVAPSVSQIQFRENEGMATASVCGRCSLSVASAVVVVDARYRLRRLLSCSRLSTTMQQLGHIEVVITTTTSGEVVCPAPRSRCRIIRRKKLSSKFKPSKSNSVVNSVVEAVPLSDGLSHRWLGPGPQLRVCTLPVMATIGVKR
jgi:hypothetical protein